MTVSDWGPDSPAGDARAAAGLPPSSAVAARTPAPEGDRTPEGRTGDLRARHELATFIAVAAYPDGMWAVPTAGDSERIADVVLSAGYRRVSEDEATVQRVALALVRADGHTVEEVLAEGEWDVYPVLARAAVRALREEDAS